MTTILRRLALPILLFLVWTPVAQAWSWPVKGPVVEPFVYDAAHPYASGQHRGIDIGADATGESVVAPAAGTVSFAGPVPTSGTSVTIETADGYSVTLTHLGSLVVTKGTSVTEGEEVGTIGPSGTPETAGPYVHLGIRATSDPDGYVDPLGFLPPVADTGGSDSSSTATQPVATQPSAGSASPPAPASQNQPAPPATATTPAPAASATGTIVRTNRAHVSQRGRGTAQKTHSDVRPQSSSKRSPVSQRLTSRGRVSRHPRLPHRHASTPMPAARRRVVEVAAPGEPTGLDAGHTLRPPQVVVQPELRQASADLLALFLNGAAALVALAAAFAAARRHSGTNRVAGAQILHLPTRSPTRRRAA
ncbi:MAG TPA: M23 family metallopeptidase [Gaiellaceae bacterium]|nr:M23 family metallopeptidase [Gaiellaceae bacterium]